jgi:hypothetical protein
MKKLILKFDFRNGWGDTFLSVFDIVNCIKYIKEKYLDIYVIFLINDIHNVNTLSLVLDIDYIKSIADEFYILNKQNAFIAVNGIGVYDNINYIRIYSGRNNNVKNNIPGIFDVYANELFLNEIINLNIPFINFTFNDIDDRVKYFPVFSQNLIKQSKDFIKQHFNNNNFESIYYRALNPINYTNLNTFIYKLKNLVDLNNTYFMCSNSALIKKMVKDSGINVVFYRDLDNHSMNHIPNGFTMYGQTIEDAIFPMTEMIILGESSNILYSGDVSNISLFNWYAINIKKTQLTSIPL